MHGLCFIGFLCVSLNIKSKRTIVGLLSVFFAILAFGEERSDLVTHPFYKNTSLWTVQV